MLDGQMDKVQKVNIIEIAYFFKFVDFTALYGVKNTWNNVLNALIRSTYELGWWKLSFSKPLLKYKSPNLIFLPFKG